MKNKKFIDNKKIYELESDIANSDIFLYENYFPVFPYNIYIKFGDNQKDNVTIENSLFFYNSETGKEHFEKEEKTDLWFYSFKWSFIFS
ncbi:hypothetical protein Py17XNL_000504463 [Plasmodium yoelii yoelii]|nr:hypothetical protein Py17XNL_000504463 [Plasmodium yoelii yoelii]